MLHRLLQLSQLTVYSLLIIMETRGEEKHKHAQIHTDSYTPTRPHTCCSSSTAPRVNGWESNYYPHTGTIFSALASQDVRSRERRCECVCSLGVICCQLRAQTRCSLAEFLSPSPLFLSLLGTKARWCKTVWQTPRSPRHKDGSNARVFILRLTSSASDSEPEKQTEAGCRSS